MDRRTVWAILLMMAIAAAPALFLKRSAPSSARPTAGTGDTAVQARPAPSAPAVPAPQAPSALDSARALTDSGVATPTAPGADTIRVTSPLYTYAFSTVGGRLVEARLPKYPAKANGTEGAAEILPPNSELLDLAVVVGRDTLSLRDWTFTPSVDSLAVNGPSSLQLTASRGGVAVELTYAFRPDQYEIKVSGRVSGVGPNGGQLLVGMGPSLANTEVDPKENQRAMALVTKGNDAERKDFSSLKTGQPVVLDGPFDWAAIKSKYFVTALLAFDSAGSSAGGISGVTAVPIAGSDEKVHEAKVRLSLPLQSTGVFNYRIYAGPMEYDRLARIGRDFDDVNPYGWPGFRSVIRVFAVPVRWLLVWMHTNLSLPYGVVLIVFGLLVRVVLWPLNQKAMRSSMQMQAIQPLMKDIQERYKSDPPRMQQEMFKLYKEHNVNPFGGCWPMLLPMPVLFALFFVFQNAIELRGASFMWIPDLSRPDPLFIIPILMGASMFVVTKIGQQGMEPNPQAKMMLYMMPGMMTVMFLFFPSGLNLYYTVSNIASIPQQWLLARERQKRTARAIVEVKTNVPASDTQAGRQAKRKKKV